MTSDEKTRRKRAVFLFFFAWRPPLGWPLFALPATAFTSAKRPPVFNQDGRFSLFSREKKSAEKRENPDTAKEETPFLRFASEKRRFILPTGTASLIPQCRKVGIAVICTAELSMKEFRKKNKSALLFGFHCNALHGKEVVSVGFRFRKKDCKDHKHL